MVRRVTAMVLAAMVAAVIAVLVQARPVAGPGPTPALSATATPATAPAASPIGATAPATPDPVVTAGAAGVVLRPDLLDVLPKTVAGSTVTRDQDREDSTRSADGLAAHARAVAAAVVGDDGENLASALLVEARAETDMTTWFAAWQVEFDQAACEAIGGVDATSERALGGREVVVTACSGGATVYHILVGGGRVILSVFELGPQEFGRQLVERLAPGA